MWFFVLMAALSLAACSGEPEKKAEGQAEPEKKTEATAESGERLLKLAMDSDPVTLDPHVQLSGSMLQYSHLVYDPLIRWDQEMQFEPRLAERWERLDPLTVRFYLRKGVKFSQRQRNDRCRRQVDHRTPEKKALNTKLFSIPLLAALLLTTTPWMSKPKCPIPCS